MVLNQPLDIINIIRKTVSCLKTFLPHYFALVTISTIIVYYLLRNWKREEYLACVEFLSIPLNPSELPLFSSFAVKGLRYCYGVETVNKKVTIRL
ncbi:MAG: hypothetical protein Q6362_008065 [Candidatus Wukongarchaeota archaeon]|nr:hypothetical protein [Candidatus Wukongarchaeota archaeon]MDO8129371.1 hypothetical protein [Candidatus Wukongarchaeota archaeon]